MHLPHLRRYRKRKHLLMLPFYRKDPRKFFAALTSQGGYLCSLGVYPYNGCLRIQAGSIDENAPYYAFSWLIFSCLKKARVEGFRGLDLSSDGLWKKRWHPLVEDDGGPRSRSLFLGRVSALVSRIYWLSEKGRDPISRNPPLDGQTMGLTFGG
ncbi:MAG TPA: hypothetical protein VI874_03365 [Candidatus Norongarragalinales archaeon]|nr:hypothetical protein [Candidatus Norongarragalinales archaeon]